MARKNQSTWTICTEWWKHLRPYNKRVQAKKERQASKKRIRDERD
jgi:hypothetical protein